MTDCTDPEVRSYLPDLLHGRLGDVDTATLSAHVESCASCAAELALLREVRASGPIAPRIDVERIVAALPRKSVTVPEAPAVPAGSRYRVRPLYWKLGAAAILVAASTFVLSDAGRESVQASRVAASAPAVAPAPAELVSPSAAPSGLPVATDSQAGGARPSLSLVAGVQDLSDEDLETLLAELDGIDTVPSAEPDPLTLSMDDLEAEG